LHYIVVVICELFCLSYLSLLHERRLRNQKNKE